MQKLLIPILIGICFFSCRRPVIKGSPLNEQGLLVIVTSPAGTNHWQKANSHNARLDPGERIPFLSLPVNMGYVPKTQHPGGEPRFLEVMILAEYIEEGAVMRVNPIGVMNGVQEDPILLSVPADTSLCTVKADNFSDFMVEHAVARRLLEDWFEQFQSSYPPVRLDWGDERMAESVLKSWITE